MTPNRPYLIRAIYEWIVDNGLTPYLMVDVDKHGVRVPGEHVRDGKITLNVAPKAVKDLELGNDWVVFHGSFSGVPREVSCPVGAVLAIYARENGHGMVFTEEAPGDQPPPGPGDKRPGKPALRVVK